jgi:hypothetical protein
MTVGHGQQQPQPYLTPVTPFQMDQQYHQNQIIASQQNVAELQNRHRKV